MDLAVRDARQHLGKFLATTVGVGLLVAIVLIMNGIFRGNIADGLWLASHSGADLWVVQRDRGGPFNESSRIPEDLKHSVQATPGVARADPFISYGVQRELAGEERQFTIVGYEVFGGMGGPDRITAGRPIRATHYEVVANVDLGLSVGDSIHLGIHDYTVVGLTDQGVDTGGNPVLYLALPDAQRVLYRIDNRAREAQEARDRDRLAEAGYRGAEAERLLALLGDSTSTISAVLVELAPAAGPSRVAAHIEDWLYQSVYSTAEQRALLMQGRLQSMTAVLGVFRSLLIGVAIVIIALLLYVLTLDKLRAIATLKLMGAGNWVIVRLTLEQSLVITVASFGLAYGLVLAIKDDFPRRLVLLPADTATTFAILFVGGVLASLVGIRKALRTPPAAALAG
ncbi:ABC transporter permease [Thiohalorhabdus sp.]|uniref:ABC transporter permease n=1 Tax=Thiohalorhabdus sp. TaxID=3094134 RepID=UPI002FC378B7